MIYSKTKIMKQTYIRYSQELHRQATLDLGGWGLMPPTLLPEINEYPLRPLEEEEEKEEAPSSYLDWIRPYGQARCMMHQTLVL